MNDKEHIRIIPGKMIFTQSTKSMSGHAIPGTERVVGEYIIQKRALPKIGKNFEILEEEYERWEVILGNQSWYYKTLAEAELAALEGIGQ